MQKLAQICIKRPVFATMLIMFLVVMGLDAYAKLGVDFFPKVEFPIVTITTSLRGAAPEEVETQVTKRIEEAVNTVSGIDDLSSVSAEGLSLVTMQFVLTKDADVAAQEVRDKVSRILSDLPDDADPPVVDKVATDASPILNVVVSSPRDMRETTKVVDDRLKKNLEVLPGVGQIRFVGDRRRQIQIQLDPERMFSYGVNVEQVRTALAAQNVEVPGGRLDQGNRELTVRTLGRIERPAEFARVIVANAGGSPVRVSDIAAVQDTFEEPRSLARLNGAPAVILEVRKQSGTNTLDVIKAVKARIEEVRQFLPRDFTIAYSRDQSGFIEQSFHAVEEHLILGAVFAGIIVLLFIRSWRSTLIAAVAIPTSIISTYTLMNMMGFTLNQITMLALVLMVGIVIDDAIVVLENIFRFMEEKHMGPIEAAVKGTADIGLAVMATTLSLVIIFLPVAMMQGIVGRFMSSFGYTAAFAIMVSLLVSFTLTPMLCSRFLKIGGNGNSGGSPNPDGHTTSTKDTGLFRIMDSAYRRMLLWSMGHRWAIVVLCLAVMVSTVPISKMIGYDFLPSDDQSLFEILIKNPPGTSIDGTAAIITRAEAEVRKLPGVKNVVTTIGADIQKQVDRGSLIVEMTPPETRKEHGQVLVMQMARKRLVDMFPKEVKVSVQLPALIQGAQNSELMFYIQGSDLKSLENYTGQVLTHLQGMKGVTDLDTNFEAGKPEVRVNINRDKASDLNVNVAQIANALRTMVGGLEQATTYREGDDRYDVMLRVEERFRTSPETMERLFVPSTTLGNVPLFNVASLAASTGPSQINRYNRNRQVMILGNVDEATGQSLSNVLQEINDKVATLNMPPEYRTGLIGASKEFGRATSNFIMAFLLSIVLMYMILAAQFESFIDPVTILISLPLSVPFALLSLMIAGENFSIIYSSVGVLVLFGIVKKNSILQIDHIKSLRAEGVERAQAILRGCEDRLRPIMMTTAALVAGMIPLALGTGAGSGSRRTVAIVVIGGQTLCLLLTLLVTPVAYSLFDDLAHWSMWSRISAMFGSMGATLRRAPVLRIFMSSLFVIALIAPMAAIAQTPQAQQPAPIPRFEHPTPSTDPFATPARVGVGVTERKLALREALEMALRNNLDLEIERNTVANAQQALNAAQGAFDGIFQWSPTYERRNTPTASILIGANGNLRETLVVQNFNFSQRFKKYGTTIQPFFENTRTSTTNPFVGLSPATTSRLGFGIIQPLMRNFRLDPQRAELRIRSKNIEISQTDFQIRVIDVVSQVEQAYWNLVAARQDSAVKSDYVGWGREQLARTRRQIDAGTLAPIEASASEAELDRRLDTFYASVGVITESENALKTLLSGGRQNEIWNDVIVPIDEKPEVPGLLPELNEAVTQALAERVELKGLDLRKDNALTQKELSLNQLKPQFNLVLNYYSSGLGGSLLSGPNPFSAGNDALYGRLNQISAINGLAPLTPPSLGGTPDFLTGSYGTTLNNIFSTRYHSVQGGIQMEWNPRNRAAQAGLQQAVLSERRIQLERTRDEQIIASQVRNALQGIQTARQRIEAAEASARAAKDKLDSEIRLFATGESTNFLVLTRQNEYADSRLRVVMANLDFNKALARLRQSTGTSLQHYSIQSK
ncbi:MAG TPA: efflux RND transporter permease subunit [Bryobacteraceae bacterium]|nr:efflux RND transporter permease subunit [Bryobacteraceae bacterium]